jgi:hypothetical protein
VNQNTQSASDSADSGFRTDRLLRGLAEKLESRGLDVSLVTYPVNGGKGEHFDAIVAVNPAAMERGKVQVEKEGLVLWEYTGTLDEARAGKILDEVTNVLRGTARPQEPRP